VLVVPVAAGFLFFARIADARERGCTLLATETGQQIDGLPSNSYRNILRAGIS